MGNMSEWVGECEWVNDCVVQGRIRKSLPGRKGGEISVTVSRYCFSKGNDCPSAHATERSAETVSYCEALREYFS